MAARRYLPSESKLQEMVERGMTHQQIADWVSAREGVTISRVAVSAALSRAGLTSRVRYDDFIPWSVKLEHQRAYQLTMLRHAAREKRGLSLTSREQARLDAWRRQLREMNLVVHYEPDSPDGFYYVRREPQDQGLIRDPRARVRAAS